MYKLTISIDCKPENIRQIQAMLKMPIEHDKQIIENFLSKIIDVSMMLENTNNEFEILMPFISCAIGCKLANDEQLKQDQI